MRYIRTDTMCGIGTEQLPRHKHKSLVAYEGNKCRVIGTVTNEKEFEKAIEAIIGKRKER